MPDPVTEKPSEFVEALDSFSRALAVIDKLPSHLRPDEEDGIREWLPRMWPTIAELRALAVSPSPPAGMRKLADKITKAIADGQRNGTANIEVARKIISILTEKQP